MKGRLAILILALGGCGAGSDRPDAAPDTPDAVPDTPDAVPDTPDAAPDTPDAAIVRYLSGEGLYADFASRTISPDAVEYEPVYPLWSDGADKRRWMFLPPGSQIDTTDMDHWRFPVGTRFFKEFSLGGTLLETRLIERVAATGDVMTDWQAGSFVWLPDGSDAIYTTDGATDVNGTPHDVPRSTRCFSCHRGEPGMVLGFSAIQLSKGLAPGVTLLSLAAGGQLTAPPPPGVDYPVPGDDTTAAALGTLHANCGHCHNPTGTAWADTQQELRLDVADRDPTTTRTWLSTVNQPTDYYNVPTAMRIVGGDPDGSAVAVRMASRGTSDQMPPLATELPDDLGVAAVRAWILTIPPP